MVDRRGRIRLGNGDLERAVEELSSTPRLSVDAFTLEDMEAYAAMLGELLDSVSRQAELPERLLFTLQESTLAASFPVLVLTTLGKPRDAARLLFHVLNDQCAVYGVQLIDDLASWPPAAVGQVEQERAGELLRALSTWLAAVSRYARGRRHAREASEIIYRLMGGLDLSRTEVGRVFDVSGETVRRWERGMVQVPARKMAALTQADAALSRLLELFEPDRLLLVIRRPAELFGGESALDWILRGRLGKVADGYERLLAYQA